MVLACVVAFHVTLRQLGEALLIDSPLAYLGLVPGGAVVIAAVRARRRAHEPDIEDRQLDLIVGGPLIAVSLVGQLILQDRLGDTFWLLRLDLLLLPLFAAGATAVLLGVRTMWRVRFGLALLFLAWPMPWSRLLSLVQDQVATATTSAVAAVAAPLGLAQQAAGSDGSLFTVDHGGEAIRLSVASACAGLNGTVSYLVVGSLLMGLTQGPAGRKLCWLICGTALAWALNLLRILVLFLVAGQWGLAAAMEVLHPVLGLLLSNIGIAVMLWRLRSFGLTFAGRREPVTPAVTRAPGARRPVPVLGTAVLVVGVVVGAGANSRLAAVAGLGDPVGGADVASYADQPVALPGFSTAALGSIPWATQYFGSASTWHRSLLSLSPGTISGELLGDRQSASILTDVVTTPSLLRMRTYSIEACYSFHGFDVRSSREVRLSPAVRGTLLSYFDPRDGRDWTALHWERPVTSADGRTEYERVVLLMVDTRQRVVPVLDSSGGVPSPVVKSVVTDNATTGDRVAAVGRLLTTVGRGLVTLQDSRSVSSDGVVRLRADGP